MNTIKLWLFLLLLTQQTHSFAKLFSEKDIFVAAMTHAKVQMNSREWSDNTGSELLSVQKTGSNEDAFLVWTFKQSAPSHFRGKRFVLQNDSDNELCFTELQISGLDSCTYVGEIGMDRIVQLNEWYIASISNQEAIDAINITMVNDNQPCEQWLAALPLDYTVIELEQSARAGKEVDFQLKGDISGGITYFVDAKINHPNKPVVLILNSYYATAWNIHHTPETQIAAIWATGYHHQLPFGMDKDTPLLSTSFDKPACKNHHYTTAFPNLEHNGETYFADKGMVQIGEDSNQWISQGNIESIKKNPNEELLAGTQGVEQLVKQGLLRPLTGKEFTDFHIRRGYEADYRVGFENEPIPGHYVILGGMTFPIGMSGGYAAYFHLPDYHTPLPTGDVGHNTVILPSGYCIGPGC